MLTFDIFVLYVLSSVCGTVKLVVLFGETSHQGMRLSEVAMLDQKQ